MLYNEFRQRTVNEITSYLPSEYKYHKVRTETIQKVNMALEAIIIQPESGNSVVPNLYLGDLYDYYCSGNTFSETMRYAAGSFLKGIELAREAVLDVNYSFCSANIVYQLINTEKNKALIDKVPHRKWMNLTMIYRMFMPASGSGFHSAIINNKLAEDYKWSEDELYSFAMENTPRLLPIKAGEIEGAFDIFTNRYNSLGAGTILYDNVLAFEAEKMESNLYIIPSSIHEMIVVSAREHDKEGLLQVLRQCNKEVLDEDELLSDSIYLYDREIKEIKEIREIIE